MQYRHADGAYQWHQPIELYPSPEAWARFWLAVETAGVWRWAAVYHNHEIMDGTQWSLELEHQGQAVKTSGSNAYPGCVGPVYSNSCEFGQLLKALRHLTGIKTIH